MLVADETIRPHCNGNEDLFFAQEDDGRKEIGRTEREALCKKICAGCPFQMRCLERALVHGEMYGVWGGMGEGERRDFRQHLKNEGYDREIPQDLELRASVNAFYREYSHWSAAS